MLSWCAIHTIAAPAMPNSRSAGGFQPSTTKTPIQNMCKAHWIEYLQVRRAFLFPLSSRHFAGPRRYVSSRRCHLISHVVRSRFTFLALTLAVCLGFGSAAKRAENLDLVDLDAFIDYLQHRPQPVAAPNDKRFVIAPRP